MNGALLALTLVLLAATAGWLLFLLIRPWWDATRPGPEVGSPRDVRDSERRWREHNTSARNAGCPCGQPATEVRRDPWVMGSVPCETWTCADHADVGAWTFPPDAPLNASERMATVPLYKHHQPIEGMDAPLSGGPIGGPTTHWYYPVKPDEVAR